MVCRSSIIENDMAYNRLIACMGLIWLIYWYAVARNVKATARRERRVAMHRRRPHCGMGFLAKAPRSEDPEQDAKLAGDAIGTEDVWFSFRDAASAFLRAQARSRDPSKNLRRLSP